LLIPFLNEIEWCPRILDTIGWQIAKDSESLFELRLKLVQKGLFSDLINWKELCDRYPIRAIRYLAALLELEGTFRRAQQSKSQRRSRIEHWYDTDAAELLKTAETLPNETWDYLVHIVVRLTASLPDDNYDPEVQLWKRERIGSKNTNIERGCVDMLIKAGQVLAQRTPSSFLSRTALLLNSTSNVIPEILIETFAFLPPDYADYGLQWLLGDLRRFCIGEGYEEPEWMPAQRLIKALAPHCSDAVFQELEQKITLYHEPSEKNDAKYFLKLWRENIYGDYWGRTQYFLLPALPEGRRKTSTSALISVLNRKFAGYSQDRFLNGGRISGGWVGSSLNKNLGKISDNAWLKIINNKDVGAKDSKRWDRCEGDQIIENTISTFARSLGYIAARFPERFARLSLRFPSDVHYEYIREVIYALSLTKPADQVPAEERAHWEPASIDTTLRVIDKFVYYIRTDLALEFCRLVQSRAAELPPDRILTDIQWFATEYVDTHRTSDLEAASSHDLLNTTLNCVRGVACSALASLLRCHRDIYGLVYQTIEKLTLKDDPVVLVALTNTLLPILNIDRPQAVAWFCTIAIKDPRIPASHYGSYFIGYTIQQYHTELEPVVESMLHAKYEKVRQRATHLLSSFHLFYGLYNKEVSICLQGSSDLKKGVAQTAVANIDNPQYACKSREFITILMNDPDKDVRTIVSGIFRKELFGLKENIEFMAEYVKSLAFADNTYSLFHTLEDYKHSLLPFAEIILKTCEALATIHLGEKRYSRSIAYGLSPLLLRLYEQSQDYNPDITLRCLDAWDLLFEHQIGSTRELTGELRDS
jgi:hypothetical protein